MTRKQVKNFTNISILAALILLSIWIVVEVSEGKTEKQPPMVDRLEGIPTGTICFGNPDGEEYHPIDCDSLEVSNEPI